MLEQISTEKREVRVAGIEDAFDATSLDVYGCGAIGETFVEVNAVSTGIENEPTFYSIDACIQENTVVGDGNRSRILIRKRPVRRLLRRPQVVWRNDDVRLDFGIRPRLFSCAGPL